MITITHTNASEHDPHKWFTEASQLGLAPGEWPKIIATTLGNLRPFIFTSFDYAGAANYRQELGCITLTIFND